MQTNNGTHHYCRHIMEFKFKTLQFLSDRKVSKSFKNRANKTGDTFSPCPTPRKLEKNEDCSTLYETLDDFIPLYIFKIILKDFPLILY